MVVQQGRLKDKDKLSRNELLEAVRFGADKIFKSKDSSITDEDIDLIINAGRRKTQELNDKFQAADKGDMLDFKLDGNSNMQTFEGVDYSGNALANAKSEVGMLGILDLGKRERKTVANYNENKLYADQVAAMKGTKPKERKKKKPIRLPKSLRLPRMEEWQMFNRTRLLAIQEEEEAAFRALPEEIQTAATAKKKKPIKDEISDRKPVEEINNESEEVCTEDATEEKSVELPPLVSEEVQEEKNTLLREGFLDWSRVNYTSFTKASAKYGRSDVAKIASEVGKSEAQVVEYSNAFWGEIGKVRFSEHEYNRVENLVAKGEKKLGDVKALRRGVEEFISLFDNPWEDLQFTHVNTKDKLFSADNDRYLLCWTHKVSIFLAAVWRLLYCSSTNNNLSSMSTNAVWNRTMGCRKNGNPTEPAVPV